MILLRRVLGDALRGRRQAQHRTLREVSTAANVSLGYLSEIERGQKEASSELLSAICDALGAHLSEVLREASDTLALAEQMDGVLVPVGGPESPARVAGEAVPADSRVPAQVGVPAAAPVGVPAGPVAVPDGPAAVAEGPVSVVDGDVSVAVHRSGPLKTTLRATRTPGGRDREVVRAA